MIETILPRGAAVSEFFGDPPEARLLPEEEPAVSRAVEKRRREYTTARHCARLAMAELGLPPVAVLTGKNREPLWPAGIIGSLTHCDGYRAAVLARTGDLASLGIDAEPHAALPDGVLPTIARPEEIPRLEKLQEQFPEIHWDRLLFSAKESVYKAWFPLARRWLGFDEATLSFDPASDQFGVALHQTGPLVDGRPLSAMSGRWLVRDGLIVTAVVVP